MSEPIELNWECLGTLNSLKPEVKDKKGIYLFVYENGKTPKRIIYVGTTKKSFKERINTHLNLFSIGARTIFFTDKEDEDIYGIMSYEFLYNDKMQFINLNKKEDKAKINEELKFKYIEKSNQVWIPKIDKNDHRFYNYFKKEDSPKNYWYSEYNNFGDILRKQYFNKISILIAEPKETDLQYLTKIESKIQCSIRNKYKIAYYKYSQLNSWLGKQENKFDIYLNSINICNNFKNISEIYNNFDSDTKALFINGFNLNDIDCKV